MSVRVRMNNAKGAKIVTAFRYLPGVEFACVDRLNLLKFAPEGHLGHFIIWTKSAFENPDVVDQGIVIEEAEHTIKEVFGVFNEMISSDGQLTTPVSSKGEEESRMFRKWYMWRL
ncbi:hypothetical protein SUGI_0332680 [Cryptomeria japonica]|nr:hypothetical protein SUGI_0332680 [Cryptomeria japonica]